MDVEGQLLQVNAKSSEANLNFPVLIDERLHSLIFSVDAGDYAPTRQQVQVFEELRNEAQPLLAKCHDLMQKDLVALNERVEGGVLAPPDERDQLLVALKPEQRRPARDRGHLSGVV